MVLQILVFLLFANYLHCKEDYTIHEVNLKDGRSEVSIIGVKNGNSYIFKDVNELRNNSFVTKGILLQQINSTGWGHLSVESSNIYSDELQAYYSGVLEGLVTRPLIEAHWYNTRKDYCSKPSVYCKLLKDYLQTNLISIIERSRNEGGFFKMIRLNLWQIKGMQDGYDNKWIRNSSDVNEDYLKQLVQQVFGLYLLQLDGDLSDIESILNGTDNVKKVIGDGSCSAFIKYVNGSLYTAHVTWSPYVNMLRLTKVYDFPYRFFYNEKRPKIIPGRRILFSSYPGMTSSIDDFYVTSGGLVTTETTIGNYNNSLFAQMKNKSSEIVLEYMRVQAANRLSESGSRWIDYFKLHNSGTYNNQWMIVNYNLMKNHKAGDPIPDGVLYIAEQIPTLIIAEDVTRYLQSSGWYSYNIPYNKQIWYLSDFNSMFQKFGNFFSFEKSPRALIFKRESGKVVDEDTLMRLMRFNDFKNDPFASCQCKPPYSGENGISARSDLNLPNGTYPFGALKYRLHGGTDLKYTTTSMAFSMKFVGISGPTYDDQPVFDWSKITDQNVRHSLHPTTFKFFPIRTPF